MSILAPGLDSQTSKTKENAMLTAAGLPSRFTATETLGNVSFQPIVPSTFMPTTLHSNASVLAPVLSPLATPSLANVYQIALTITTAIWPSICVFKTVQTPLCDTLITSQETASQSAHRQLTVRTPPLLPDAKTSVLLAHLPRMESAFVCLTVDLAFTVIRSPGNVTLILKAVLKVTTPIPSVTCAYCQPIANQTSMVSTFLPRTRPKPAFLNVRYRITVTATFGCAFQFATTLTSEKTRPDNVCQDAELMFHSLKSKIAFACRDAQLNRSELSQRTSLTLVWSRDRVPRIVTLKTTLVCVFCTVPRLHQ